MPFSEREIFLVQQRFASNLPHARRCVDYAKFARFATCRKRALDVANVADDVASRYNDSSNTGLWKGSSALYRPTAVDSWIQESATRRQRRDYAVLSRSISDFAHDVY